MKLDKAGPLHDTQRLSTSKVEPLDAALASTSRVLLLVYHRDGVETATLSPGVSVVVGREPPSDIVIHDRSLSRRHARFTLQDGDVIVEDVGSTNGTTARGQRIARGVVKAGDEVAMGAVTATVHILAGAQTTALGLEGHDLFRGALDAEITRSRFFARPLALLVVRALPGGESHLRHWCPRVQGLLRPVDRIALYSQDTIEILLPEATAEDAEKVAAAITAPREGASPLVCGIAAFPGAAASGDALIAAGLDAARAAGAGAPVRIGSPEPRTFRPAAHSDSAGADEARRFTTYSPRMRALVKGALRVARSGIPVLLHGETGSGKEVMAQLIHENSPRRAAPLVCVNCGALSPSLIADTLFGHERGAFTHAERQHKGVFEAASGGTVFLDEVGELPPEAQAALLRVLEVKKVTRLGSTKEIDVDVRLIAATHRDLAAMSAQGAFRSDLMYRLNTATLQIPPLRARREDIPALAMLFLEQAAEAHGCGAKTFTPEALTVLEGYAWPGNVRELRNAIERAAVIAEGSVITLEDLPERVRGAAVAAVVSEEAREEKAPAPASVALQTGGLRETIDRIERELILEVLRGVEWNVAEAASQLVLPVRTLQYKMKTLGIIRQYTTG